VSQDVVDAFAMMRVAELVRDGLVDPAMDRALAQARNGGSQALVERANAIRHALGDSSAPDVRCSPYRDGAL
jgi:hypothetical protein